MYPEFESCDHILEEIYDSALEQGLCPSVVDDTIHRAYWQHKDRYRNLGGSGLDYESRRHELSVHILEDHVRPEVERLVGDQPDGLHVCMCEQQYLVEGS